MDYKFFIIIFILIIVGVTILFSLTLSARISVGILAHRPTDLLSYYIYNMPYTIFCTVFYISFFVVFLYSLRAWNRSYILDLHMVYSYVLQFFHLPLLFCIPATIFGLFICINLFLLFVRIHKYCLHHIYILYLYIRYSPNVSQRVQWFFYKLAEPFHFDIIAYAIKTSLFRLNRYLLKDIRFNGLAWYSPRARIPWYYLLYHVYDSVLKIVCNKYYEKFVTFSPLFFIIYDCIFNNFLISHLYNYLLIYVPVILWRRITICLFTDASDICELLCNIYYKKETCIYAILAEHKIVLESYLISGLRSNIDLGLEIEMYLKSASCFVPDMDERNLYCNNEGIHLEKRSSNTLVRKILDEEVFTEEWILLVDK